MAASSTLRELRLRDFRNFTELEQAFPAAGIAIIGENGAGKTNLLEAIYYLEIFRSFRGAPDEQLVRFGAETFHVRGRFEDESGLRLEVGAGFEARGRRKKVMLDGAEAVRLGDALGQAGAVIFSPADVAVVRGSPAERRRFLDIVLSLNRSGYLGALQRYRAVLRQRNAVLREPRAARSLHAWDDALVEAGTTVMLRRAEWVTEVGPAFTRRYGAISGGQSAELRYVSGIGKRLETEVLLDAERSAQHFRTELERVAERERERRMSLVGPHRDDLMLAMAGAAGAVDLRDYGSGGQVRTAAIALRMVEADTIRQRRGRDPLILLDDVFAELDRPRSLRILELLEHEQPGQAVLTAPKDSDLELRHGQLQHWRLNAGRLEA